MRRTKKLIPLAIALSFTMLASAPARATVLFDPHLTWRTLVTPHFRIDYPETSDLSSSRFTVVRQRGERVVVDEEPVMFNIVRPGDTVLAEGLA